MTDTDRDRDPLPEEFASEDEAGEFWDTHSIVDYQDCLEAVNVDVDLQGRHFEIEIDRDTFLALSARAKETHKSLKDLAIQILSKTLVSA